MEEAGSGCDGARACAGCGWRDWDRCARAERAGRNAPPRARSMATGMLSPWKQEFAYVGRHPVWGRHIDSLPAFGN